MSLSIGDVFYCADIKCMLEKKEVYLAWKRGGAEKATDEVPASPVGQPNRSNVSKERWKKTTIDSPSESMTQAFPGTSPEKRCKTPTVTPRTAERVATKSGATTATTIDYHVATEEPTQRMGSDFEREQVTAEKMEDSSSRSSDMMFGAYDEGQENEPARRINFEVVAQATQGAVQEEDDRSTVVDDPNELAKEQATQIAQLESVEEDPAEVDEDATLKTTALSSSKPINPLNPIGINK